MAKIRWLAAIIFGFMLYTTSLAGCIFSSKSTTYTLSNLNLGDYVEYEISTYNKSILTEYKISHYEIVLDCFGAQRNVLTLDFTSSNEYFENFSYCLDLQSKEPIVLYTEDERSHLRQYSYQGVYNLDEHMKYAPFFAYFFIDNISEGENIERNLTFLGVPINTVSNVSENGNISMALSFSVPTFGKINGTYAFEKDSPYPTKVYFDAGLSMTLVSVERGSTPVEWLKESNGGSGTQYRMNPNGEYKLWNLAPSDGENCMLPLKLSDAQDTLNTSSAFNEFMTNHPDAYLVKADYDYVQSYAESILNSGATWELLYGSPSSPEWYSAEITNLLGINELPLNYIASEGQTNYDFYIYYPPRSVLNNTCLTVQSAIDIIQSKLPEGRTVNFLHWSSTGINTDVGTPGELLWQGGSAGGVNDPNKPVERMIISAINGQTIVESEMYVMQ